MAEGRCFSFLEAFDCFRKRAGLVKSRLYSDIFKVLKKVLLYGKKLDLSAFEHEGLVLGRW